MRTILAPRLRSGWHGFEQVDSSHSELSVGNSEFDISIESKVVNLQVQIQGISTGACLAKILSHRNSSSSQLSETRRQAFGPHQSQGRSGRAISAGYWERVPLKGFLIKKNGSGMKSSSSTACKRSSGVVITLLRSTVPIRRSTSEPL